MSSHGVATFNRMGTETNSTRRIPKVVLTGGPSAGKTTALRHLRTRLADMGYAVFVLNEVVTGLHEAGVDIAVAAYGYNEWEFQQHLLELQIRLEDSLEAVARLSAGDRPAVILCDRGAVDSAGWMGLDRFEQLTAQSGRTLDDLYGRYSGVVALVTSADGAEDAYMRNTLRPGDTEAARALDRKIQAVWEPHPRCVTVANVEDGKPVSFDEKLERVVEAVVGLLAAES